MQTNKESDIVYHDVVTGSDSGWILEMSPVSAFQRVQNAMCIYLGELELDGGSLVRKYHATWVVTRNKIDFLKPLLWNEHFYARCRVVSKTAARCVLNIGLFNEENALCISSHMEMCVLDLETKRIRKLSSIGFDIIQPQAEFYRSDFTKINTDILAPITLQRIALSNIDYNLHTNNVEYMRFILDTYILDDVREKTFRSIQIDYVNQSRLGDLLTVSKEENGTTHTIIIRCGDNLIVRSQVAFSDCRER